MLILNEPFKETYLFFIKLVNVPELPKVENVWMTNVSELLENVFDCYSDAESVDIFF